MVSVRRYRDHAVTILMVVGSVCCVTAVANAQFATKTAGETKNSTDAPASPASASPASNLHEHTASSVADAPKPGEITGILVSGERASDDILRWIPRTIFFVPRVAFEAVVAPLRGTLWLYDRYQLKNRFETLFFNDEGTIGVFPVALFESGFGLNVGARAIFRELFGKGEGLRFRLSYGGRFEQLYTFSLSSGNRFGATEVKLAGEYARHSGDNFFGLGNTDTVDSVGAPVNVFDRTSSVETEFQQKVLALSLSVERSFFDNMSIEFLTLLRRRSFDSDVDDVDIVDVYQESSLIGFETGVRDLNTTLELSYDTRRRASVFQMKPAMGSGMVCRGSFRLYVEYWR